MLNHQPAWRRWSGIIFVVACLGLGAAAQGSENCANFPGTDVGQRINACIAALPNGGVADATSITGNQTTAVTITDGAKPVKLLLGAMTLTSTANPAINFAGSSWIEGVSAGTGGTEIDFITANADCIHWSGSHGGIAHLSCAGVAGTGDGLVLAAQQHIAIQYNVFDNIRFSGDQYTANHGIYIAGFSNLSLACFNQFRDITVVGFQNGIELTSDGIQGVTDNQFIGGQVRGAYQTAVPGSVGGLLQDVAISSFVGTEFSGWDIGLHLTNGAHDNHFFGAQAESNVTNYLIDAGATDNHFIGIEGQGFVDDGTRTVLIATNNDAGEQGSTIMQLPAFLKNSRALDQFSVVDDNGRALVTTAATGVGVGTTTPKGAFDANILDQNVSGASSGLVCEHGLAGMPPTSIQPGFGCKISFEPADIGGTQVERGSIADVWTDPANTRDALVFSTANSPAAVRMSEEANGLVGLQLNGGPMFAHTPRSTWGVFLPGALDHVWTAATAVYPQPVVIESISVAFKTPGLNCASSPGLTLSQNGTILWTGSLGNSGSTWSGLALTVAANQTLQLRVGQGAGACSTTPSDANVALVYRPE